MRNIRPFLKKGTRKKKHGVNKGGLKITIKRKC